MGYKSPRTYCLFVGASGIIAPVDSTTYYLGCMASTSLTATVLSYSAVIPYSGRIRAGNLLMRSNTTIGTNEDIIVTIRKNDTTDYAFSTVGLATANRLFSNYNLDIPVSAGDFIDIKIVTPAWVTNPDGCRFGGYLFIECE